jgi:uncharacterized protein
MEKSGYLPESGERALKAFFMLTFYQRWRGLAWYRFYPYSRPCYFPRCRGIHTAGMRFPIDVVMLDRENKITALYPNLGPFRFRWRREAGSVLEMPAGGIQAHSFKIGESIRVMEP